MRFQHRFQVVQVHRCGELAGLLFEKRDQTDDERRVAVPMARVIKRQVEQGFARDAGRGVRLRSVVLKQFKPAHRSQAG